MENLVCSNNWTSFGGLHEDEAIEEPIKKRRKAPITVLLGRFIIFTTIISFLFVGLLVNILQLLVLISLQLNKKNPKWRSFHKRLNSYLVTILFAPTVALTYTWSRLNLNIQLEDLKFIKESKGPMLGIVIPNHSYELDYMISFALADQLSNLGLYKSFSKDELKYLPICGWALWMSDIIFVKRCWNQDKKRIENKLNQLFDYEHTLLGLFAEGTRWTPEKHKLSQEYAKSKGIEPLEYHLIPKVRGFTYTIRHYLREIALNNRMEEKYFRIFNLEIVMRKKLRFGDFMRGEQIEADIYCEEVILNDDLKQEALNSKDDDDCPKIRKLIYDIFKRKDEIVREYKLNGNKFVIDPARGGPFPFKRRIVPVIIWLVGLCLTYMSFFYLATNVFAKSVTFWSLLIGFIIGCSQMLNRISYESHVENSRTQKNAATSKKNTSSILSEQQQLALRKRNNNNNNNNNNSSLAC